jgi:hypothetical protein
LYLQSGYVEVTNTDLLAIIVDVSGDDVTGEPSLFSDLTEAEFYPRTTTFGYYLSADQVTRLLTPALATYTITINLWNGGCISGLAWAFT